MLQKITGGEPRHVRCTDADDARDGASTKAGHGVHSDVAPIVAFGIQQLLRVLVRHVLHGGVSGNTVTKIQYGMRCTYGITRLQLAQFPFQYARTPSFLAISTSVPTMPICRCCRVLT
jgi:hypothetical protein